jgi:hypothetical protein
MWNHKRTWVDDLMQDFAFLLLTGIVPGLVIMVACGGNPLRRY